MKRRKKDPKIEECLQVNMMDDLEGAKPGDNVYIPIYQVMGKASTIFRNLEGGKIGGFSLITCEGIHEFLRGTFDYIMARQTQEIINGIRSCY